MLTPRIYHPTFIGIQTELQLTENASRHVVSVLRLIANAKLCVFDGSGIEYHAILVDPHKRHAMVRVVDKVTIDRESPLSITLVHALARGDKMDFIIQKAVELGVSRFIPVFTEFSNIKLTTERLQKRMQHWQGVIISASEQCGRNQLMQLAMPIEFARWLPQVIADQSPQLRLLLSPDGTSILKNVFATQQLTTVTIAIGCEGGFSPQEHEIAKQHGFTMLRFGSRVLRTETAALAVVSALQTYYGDFT